MKSETNYVKIASHEAKKGEFDTCLLLYSGGLDTSVMLKWIQEEYNCGVVCLTVDLGQTADDLYAIKDKALALGAKDCIIHDATSHFAGQILTKAIKANADYQGGYALSCPLGRVAISEVAVQVAKELGINVIAHGATGKGNDQVRFEAHITALDPTLKTIAPVREWAMGRDEEIEYAKKHGIPVEQTSEKPYSYDENMWGNTGEGGEIEDPEKQPSLENILKWCNTIDKTPDLSHDLVITFKEGIPVQLDKIAMPLAEIIDKLNKVGGTHGVGVTHLIEDRFVGLKVRGVYEQPAAAILIEAHKRLEKLVSTREENELKAVMDNKWAYLAYAAKWCDPVMENINAYMDKHNEKVTGEVIVQLYKGNITVTNLRSPYSLFQKYLATFNKDTSFNQNSSPGFIELYNLPMKTAKQIEYDTI